MPSVLNRSNFSKSGLVIKDFVVEYHVDVEAGKRVLTVAKAGQTETGCSRRPCQFIEENVGAGKTLVSVFGSVVDAVVVIPQRVHRLLNIAALRNVRRVHSRQARSG